MATPTKMEVCTVDEGTATSGSHENESCNTVYMTGNVKVDIEAAEQLLQGYPVMLYDELVLLMNATYSDICTTNAILVLGTPSTSWVNCDLPNGVSAQLTVQYGGSSSPPPPRMTLSACNDQLLPPQPSGDESENDKGDNTNCKQMTFDPSGVDVDEQLKKAGKLLRFGF